MNAVGTPSCDANDDAQNLLTYFAASTLLHADLPSDIVLTFVLLGRCDKLEPDLANTILCSPTVLGSHAPRRDNWWKLNSREYRLLGASLRLYFKQHGTELTRLLLLAEAQRHSRLRLHITDSFRRWFDCLTRVDWGRATTSSELAFRVDDAVCVLKDLSDRASRNKLAPACGNTDWL